MKIAIFSDLHLEFSNGHDHWLFDFGCWSTKSWADGVDLAIMAGDISNAPRLKKDLNLILPEGLPAVFVPGNHEYYGGDLLTSEFEMRDTLSNSGVLYLNNDSVELPGVEIVGSTLWYNECLSDLNDASMIHRFESMVADKHESSKAYLDFAMTKPKNAVRIVVTHHAPIPPMSRPEHRGSRINRAFVPDLTSLLSGRELPDIWISGHTHNRIDMEWSGCRFINWCAGYPGELEGEFMPLVIEA